MLYIGIDVAKAVLAIYNGLAHLEIANNAREIKRFLKALPEGSVLALEATGGYGMPLAEIAVELGFTVYILRPQQVSAFRKAMDDRAKTDKKDAQLIQEFIVTHHKNLRPFLPLAEPYKSLSRFSRARATLMQKKASLRLCLEDLGEDASIVMKALQTHIEKLDEKIEKILREIPKALALQTIPSVKQATVAAILPALASKNFKNRDAFIAYMGLDLKVADSGTQKGRRRLSHQGDPNMRKALYMAAMSASHSKTWKEQYTKLRQKLPGIAALNALARKLAKVIFAIYKHNTTFQAQHLT